MASLFEAIESGDLDRVRGLVEADPSLTGARDAQGGSALLQAQYRGRPDIVEVLLAARPELDFFEAAALGVVERSKELLADDATLARAYSVDGFTGLQLAAFFGQPDVVELLLKRGAEVEAVSRNPNIVVQALHSAAAGGHARSVELLLAAGADANARQEGGFTPLMSAAQNGDAESLELLLGNGADPTLKDDAGKTAADLARDAGHAALGDRLT